MFFLFWVRPPSTLSPCFITVLDFWSVLYRFMCFRSKMHLTVVLFLLRMQDWPKKRTAFRKGLLCQAQTTHEPPTIHTCTLHMLDYHITCTVQVHCTVLPDFLHKLWALYIFHAFFEVMRFLPLCTLTFCFVAKHYNFICFLFFSNIKIPNSPFSHYFRFKVPEPIFAA